MATAEELKTQFDVKDSNLQNIDKIAAMGSTPDAPAPKVINKTKLEGDIRKTLETPGIGTKTANKEFINAMAQFKLGRDASAEELGQVGSNEFALGGSTVSDVLGRFGASDLAPSYGIGLDEEEITGPAPTGDVAEVAEQPKALSAQDKIAELLGGVGTQLAETKAQARKDVGLSEKSQAIAEAQTVVSDLVTQLANQQIIDEKEIRALEGQGRGIPLSIINAQQADLSSEQKLDLMITQNNLNNALVQQNIAQGNYDRAQSIVQETADTFFENFQFQLQALEAQGQIDDKEARALETQAMFERDLTRDEGFMPITPEQASTMREADTWEDPVTGKFYRRPAVGAGETFTLTPGQTRFDANGNIIASVVKPGEDPLDELLSPNELVLFNAPAGSTMKDVLGAIPKSTLTGTQKFAEEIKLGKQFEALVGDTRKATVAIDNINASMDEARSAIENDSTLNPASQGVLVAFQKLLDPDSVVRESEYSRSGNGQSLWDNMKGTWQKIEQGGAGVTIEEMQAFTDVANVYLKGYENSALKHAKRMQVISERQGLDLKSILTEDMIGLIEKSSKPVEYNTIKAWAESKPDNLDEIKTIIISEDLTESEGLQLINRMNERSNFNGVGGDTDIALPDKAAKAKTGDKGGQCGRFVNNATGLGVGDSYASKMAKMDPTIKTPEPGMVFTIPYKDTGHTGFIVGIEGDNAIVKDSNWSLDEKVKTHKIPLNKISGLARV